MTKMLLTNEVSRRISKDFLGGEKLPSERHLAKRYSCTRGTIRNALSLLKKDGLINSVARQGHELAQNASQEYAGNQFQSAWPSVVLLTGKQTMRDAHYMDMIGGAIHQSQLNQINLIVRELPDIEQIELTQSLDDLHSGVEASGYLITERNSPKLIKMLETSLLPGAVLGSFDKKITYDKMRLLRVLLPQEMIYRQVAQHLVSLGHRHILLAFPTANKDEIQDEINSAFRWAFDQAGLDKASVQTVREDVWQSDVNFDITSQRYANRVVESLQKKHTALVSVCGGRAGMELWKKLLSSGRRVPDALSVIIASGRNDIYVDSFNIATVFSDAWEQGVTCISEIAKQIHTGTLEYGVKYTPFRYIPRQSVGAAYV